MSIPKVSRRLRWSSGTGARARPWCSLRCLRPPCQRRIPACPAQTAIFRGDNEDLIDHLIFASHEHKLKMPLKGFGRELVPFFAPGEDLAPLTNNARCAALRYAMLVLCFYAPVVGRAGGASG